MIPPLCFAGFGEEIVKRYVAAAKPSHCSTKERTSSTQRTLERSVTNRQNLKDLRVRVKGRRDYRQRSPDPKTCIRIRHRNEKGKVTP